MELTGPKKSHVYQLFASGELTGYCSGRRQVFFESGVRQYVKRNRKKPAPLNTPRPDPAAPEAAAPHGGAGDGLPLPVSAAAPYSALAAGECRLRISRCRASQAAMWL
jgi:hypothetical protein